MAASGDLVIPHLAGLPYLDKPPALFWAGAAFVRLMGPVPLAVRLPALLAGLATLLLVMRVSTRLEPDGHARRTTALLAGAPLFVLYRPEDWTAERRPWARLDADSLRFRLAYDAAGYRVYEFRP